MYVGLLTAPFGRESLEQVIAFAAKAGFRGLEVTAGPGAHVDTARFTPSDANRIKDLVAKAGIQITSLAYYRNICDGNAETGEHYLKAIDAAVLLGTDVVCGLAGMPVAGKSKADTIREVVTKAYRPVLDHARDKGVKIALENWYATNIQHFGLWDLLFELIPDPHFGLNYDPSHLLWQGIDYLGGVERYKDRIFHTHAKDTEVKQHVLRHVGCLESGWWRYVIPGFGEIDWGVYIERLYGIGYTGVLSIEHEDGRQGREEGFIRGLRHLSQFVD
ncbi:MAG: sugar phosphate isomerase/epimerase [Candidatus Latescibacterota bacterium]|jgi:sugar phosphate isomerase/epimerase